MPYILVLFLYALIPSISLCNEDLKAQESSIDWLDTDKEIYVLQNRVYSKKGKFSLYGNIGKTTSGAFVDSLNFSLRANYFLNEKWGIEILYSVNNGQENDTAESVRNKGGAGSVPFRLIIENYMGAMAQWAPFYSKVNFFNTIIYFDLILGVGAASISENNNRSEYITGGLSKVLTQQSHTAFLWNVGFKIFISKMFNLRFDLTTTHFSAQKALLTATENDTQLYSNYDLGVGLEISF